MVGRSSASPLPGPANRATPARPRSASPGTTLGLQELEKLPAAEQPWSARVRDDHPACGERELPAWARRTLHLAQPAKEDRAARCKLEPHPIGLGLKLLTAVGEQVLAIRGDCVAYGVERSYGGGTQQPHPCPSGILAKRQRSAAPPTQCPHRRQGQACDQRDQEGGERQAAKAPAHLPPSFHRSSVCVRRPSRHRGGSRRAPEVAGTGVERTENQAPRVLTESPLRQEATGGVGDRL